MIKGINYWAINGDYWVEKVSPQKAIDIAKEYGFEAIELAVSENGFININSTKKEIINYLNYAENRNIKISSLASVLFCKYNLASPLKNEAKKAKNIVAKILELASWMKTDAILVLSGFVDNIFFKDKPIIPYDIVYDRTFEAMEELKIIAESLKVHICIENCWNKFFLSPLEFRDFIDCIKSKYVSAYFDIANVITFGYPEHWIKILGDKIKRIHINDYNKSIGGINGFCRLLEGDVNYLLVAKAIKEINYDGYLIAEVAHKSKDMIALTSKSMDKILRLFK